MDKTGKSSGNVLIVGFAVRVEQSSYIVVDSRVQLAYQAQPGRQEWVTAIEYICMDGSSIVS
jgi:hypothetical protein